MIHRLYGHADPPKPWNVLLQAKGNLAFDIGANIGQAAQVLADRFGKVVAFEPCVESFEVLREEMPANVTCLNEAVSDHDGEVVLEEMGNCINTGQLVSSAAYLPFWGEKLGERTVPCATIDTLAVEYGPPDFIKVDTEGHEVMVIRGGRKTFESLAAPQIIVECHQEEHGQAIRDLLPWYKFEKFVWEHGVYRHRQLWRDHYWLAGRPR